MKQTTGISGAKAIQHLLHNNWHIVTDPNQVPKKTAKKSFNEIRSQYPNAKVSQTGSSVYLTDGETEVTVKCKGNLTFVQLQDLQRDTKLKLG